MASAFLHSKGSCQDSSLIQEALLRVRFSMRQRANLRVRHICPTLMLIVIERVVVGPMHTNAYRAPLFTRFLAPRDIEKHGHRRLLGGHHHRNGGFSMSPCVFRRHVVVRKRGQNRSTGRTGDTQEYSRAASLPPGDSHVSWPQSVHRPRSRDQTQSVFPLSRRTELRNQIDRYSDL